MKKHRKFASETKAKICLQILSGAKSTAQLCREYQLSEQIVGRWKKQFLEKANLVFEKEATPVQEDRRVAELERMVGRLTMELELAASTALGQLLTRSGR